MSRRSSTSDASHDRHTTRRVQLGATRRGRRWTRRFRVGEHNLHDRAGIPVLLGPVMLFCEAIPSTILRRALAAVKRGLARARGYRVVVCRQQRDLVIVVRRWLFKVESVEYRLAHHGEGGVTPHRGTFVVKGRLRGTPIRVALLLEHRVNAAFPPYVRGEAELRQMCWHTHTDLTVGWIRELKAAGFVVIAGGDLNTPPHVDGYDRALVEVSTSLDRIGCSSRVHDDEQGLVIDAHLSDFRRGKRRRSDHHEISAEQTVSAYERKAA